MTVQERINLIRLIEKMNQQNNYCNVLQIKDTSKFNSERKVVHHE